MQANLAPHSVPNFSNPVECHLPKQIDLGIATQWDVSFFRGPSPARTHFPHHHAMSASVVQLLLHRQVGPMSVIVTSRGIWICHGDEYQEDRSCLLATNEENDWVSASISSQSASKTLSSPISAPTSNDILVATLEGVKAYHFDPSNLEMSKTADQAGTILAEHLNDDIEGIATNPSGNYLAISFANCSDIWVLALQHSAGRGLSSIREIHHKYTLDRGKSNVMSPLCMEFITDFHLLVANPTKLITTWKLDEDQGLDGKPFAIPFKSHFMNTAFSFRCPIVGLGNTNGDVMILELRTDSLILIGSANVGKSMENALKGEEHAASEVPRVVSISKRRQDMANRPEDEVVESNFAEVSHEILDLEHLYLEHCSLHLIVAVTKLGMAVINAKSRDIVAVLLFRSPGGLFNCLISCLKMVPNIHDERVHLKSLVQPLSNAKTIRLVNFEISIGSGATSPRDWHNIQCADIEGQEAFQNEGLSLVAMETVQKGSFLRGNLCESDSRKTSLSHSSKKSPSSRHSSHYGGLIKWGANNLGKKVLDKLSSSHGSKPPPNRLERVKSSGYGREPPRRNLFQPRINRNGESVSKRRASYGSESTTLLGLHDGLDEKTADMNKSGGGNESRRKWTINGASSRSEERQIPQDLEYSWSNHDQTQFDIWSSQESSKTQVEISSRGQYLASFGSGSIIQMFNASTLLKPKSNALVPFSRLSGHKGPIRSLHFSHHFHDFLVSSSDDRSVRLWDVKGGKSLCDIKHRIRAGKRESIPIFPDTVVRSQFYYMDTFLLSASANKLFIHGVTLTEEAAKLRASPTTFACEVSHLKTLNLSQCKFITDFTAVNHFYSYLAMCACSDKGLRIMDFNQQAIAWQVLQAHARPMHKVLLPKTGENIFLSVAIADGAKLWDLRTAQCCHRFDWPNAKRTPPGLDWSPCSNFLAFGNEDGSVHVFDSRQLSGYVAKLDPLSAITSGITDIKFHPHKPWLLNGFQNGQLAVMIIS